MAPIHPWPSCFNRLNVPAPEIYNLININSTTILHDQAKTSQDPQPSPATRTLTPANTRIRTASTGSMPSPPRWRIQTEPPDASNLLVKQNWLNSTKALPAQPPSTTLNHRETNCSKTWGCRDSYQDRTASPNPKSFSPTSHNWLSCEKNCWWPITTPAKKE